MKQWNVQGLATVTARCREVPAIWRSFFTKKGSFWASLGGNIFAPVVRGVRCLEVSVGGSIAIATGFLILDHERKLGNFVLFMLCVLFLLLFFYYLLKFSCTING